MKSDTRLQHTKVSHRAHQTVNPPVEKGSSLLVKTRAELYGTGTVYGRMGLGVQRELEAALRTLENGTHAQLTANGLQACALAVASIARSGDHILIADNLYGPNRRFCTRRLSAMGITASRFPPNLTPDALERMIKPETRAIVLESPGSLSFEITDTPAVVKMAERFQITTILDNTWSAGVFHRPLELGVDLTVQSLSKYAIGHADAMGGVVVTRSETLAKKLQACANDWGLGLSADDAYLALRGLRTLHNRLRQHERSGLQIADWLANRPEIDSVLHPARSDHPQHHLWKRDFTGACGLFGAILRPVSDVQLDRFLEALKLFRMGFSWGGYESLLIPSDGQLKRLKEDPILQKAGPLLRLHVGLEDVDDLMADLGGAFNVMAANA